MISKFVLGFQILKNYFLTNGNFYFQNLKEFIVRQVEPEYSDKIRYPKTIIAVTSYPARYKYLVKTIRSILSQSVQPEKILISLAAKDATRLPSNLRRLEKKGVSFVVTDDDVKVYLKLVPIMQKFSDHSIITIDDDIYYPPKWFETLLKAHIRHPQDIICYRGVIFPRVEEQDEPFKSWPEINGQNYRSLNLIATGVGGTFYPPHSLNNIYGESNLFTVLSPTSDDLWYHFMANINGTYTTSVGEKFQPRCWPGSQKNALWRANVIRGKNDEALQALSKYFSNDYLRF